MAENSDNVVRMPVRTARLHITLAEDTMLILKSLANKNGTTVTETVRRAVAVLKFVEDEKAQGNKLAVVEALPDGNAKVREVVLLND